MDPSSRLSDGLWLKIRDWMLENDPDVAGLPHWSNNFVGAPKTPEELAEKIIRVILSAGMKAQSVKASSIRIVEAIQNNAPVDKVFNHKGKSKAIENIWKFRKSYFESLQKILSEGEVSDLVNWCVSIPYVGPVTKYHLAKNLGADLVKPDIWLCRLTGISEDLPAEKKFADCMALAKSLAEKTGDSIAAVDSLLWLACNKGVLRVDSDSGAIIFQPERYNKNRIY